MWLRPIEGPDITRALGERPAGQASGKSHRQSRGKIERLPGHSDDGSQQECDRKGDEDGFHGTVDGANKASHGHGSLSDG